ncbi:MAG: SPOR domain-containing protein [Pseudomonadota bacterium]|nr:SPOR domain-containing protein [Pseudomonadota bacterium]
MDDGLKQRLIGAVILLGIGVLFVPALFEPGNQRQIDITPQVPPAPPIEPLVLQKPVRNPDIEEPKSSADMYRLVPTTEEAKEASKPVKVKEGDKKPVVLDDKGVPQAWVVQVSSYKSEKTAEAFLAKLRKADYRAFSKTLETSKGRVTRVYVGPKINKKLAKELKQELDKKYGLQTLLVRFEP